MYIFNSFFLLVVDYSSRSFWKFYSCFILWWNTDDAGTPTNPPGFFTCRQSEAGFESISTVPLPSSPSPLRPSVLLLFPQILSTMSTENTSDFEDLQKKFGRFRILIVGRANAGKTTILRAICNTTENPEIYDGDGNKVRLQADVLYRRVYATPHD